MALESLGMIWIDYILHYYDRHRMMLWREEGELRGDVLDIERLSDAIFSCNVSAGMAGYWSEIASLNTLENLLKGGLITLEQYLERLPAGYIDSKDALLEDIKRAREEAAILEAEGIREEGSVDEGQRGV